MTVQPVSICSSVALSKSCSLKKFWNMTLNLHETGAAQSWLICQDVCQKFRVRDFSLGPLSSKTWLTWQPCGILPHRNIIVKWQGLEVCCLYFWSNKLWPFTNYYNIYFLSFSVLYVPLITLKEIWTNNAYKSFFFNIISQENKLGRLNKGKHKLSLQNFTVLTSNLSKKWLARGGKSLHIFHSSLFHNKTLVKLKVLLHSFTQVM